MRETILQPPHACAYLCCQDTGNLSFVLRLRLSDQGSVEDQTVLGRVVLGLERSEEGLLCSQNLDRRRWVLRQVEQRTCVRNQTSTDQLSHLL
jgi:hypothetical protein